jgi:hypothetical protein
VNIKNVVIVQSDDAMAAALGASLRAGRHTRARPRSTSEKEPRSQRTILRGTIVRAHSRDLFLCGASHARAVWIPPESAEQRMAWSRWLKALVMVVAASSAVMVSAAIPNPAAPSEATTRMERLAAKIDRAGALDPRTALAIAGLVEQPAYDCAQVACGAQLQARNGAARARLAAALARHGPPVLEAAASRRSDDDEITTASTK